MNWNFHEGDLVIFSTTQSDLLCHNGKEFEVLRRLTEDEADLFETGPMYKLGISRYAVGEPRLEIDAFEDELELSTVGKFVRMVELYKALGYRMVCFEKEGEGGWVQAFDTHGLDATELPKSAFAVPDNEPWERMYGWKVTDEDVRIYDDTDDPLFIADGYDYEANFPVLQLAE